MVDCKGRPLESSSPGLRIHSEQTAALYRALKTFPDGLHALGHAAKTVAMPILDMINLHVPQTGADAVVFACRLRAQCRRVKGTGVPKTQSLHIDWI